MRTLKERWTSFEYKSNKYNLTVEELRKGRHRCFEQVWFSLFNSLFMFGVLCCLLFVDIVFPLEIFLMLIVLILQNLIASVLCALSLHNFDSVMYIRQKELEGVKGL